MDITSRFSYIVGYRFVNLFLGEFIQKIIPIIIYVQTESLAWLGISFAITWLPRVLLQPFLGMIIDRFHVKYAFLGSDFFRAIILMPLIWTNDPYLLSVIGAVFGLAAGISYMGLEYALTHCLGIVRTAEHQVKIQNSEQLAVILAPLAAGFIAGSAMLIPSIILATLCYFVLPVLLQKILDDIKKPADSKYVIAGLVLGIKEIFSKKSMIGLVGITSMINLLEGIAFAIMPAVVISKFYQDEYMIGLILSLSSVFSLLMMSILSRFKDIDVNICKIFGLLLFVLGGLIFGNSGSIAVFALGYTLLIVGRVLFVVYMRVERANLLTQKNFGTALGVFLSLILLPMPVSGFLVSYMPDVKDVGYMMNIMMGLFLFVLLIFMKKKSVYK